jgi:hypothetical protein
VKLASLDEPVLAALVDQVLRGDEKITWCLAASDGAGVGVDHIGFVVDPPGFLLPYSSPFDVSSDSASHTVSASAADKLTNTESLAPKASFAIDRTPPSLTIGDAFDGSFHYTQNELVNGMFTNGSILQTRPPPFSNGCRARAAKPIRECARPKRSRKRAARRCRCRARRGACLLPSRARDRVRPRG